MRDATVLLDMRDVPAAVRPFVTEAASDVVRALQPGGTLYAIGQTVASLRELGAQHFIRPVVRSLAVRMVRGAGVELTLEQADAFVDRVMHSTGD